MSWKHTKVKSFHKFVFTLVKETVDTRLGLFNWEIYRTRILRATSTVLLFLIKQIGDYSSKPSEKVITFNNLTFRMLLSVSV